MQHRNETKKNQKIKITTTQSLKKSKLAKIIQIR